MSSVAIIQESITALATDAIVNAANEELRAGSGVCGAIFAAAGHTRLQEACAAIGHCNTGKAVITPGFALKSPWIIHTPGPRYTDGKHGEPELLGSSYQSSLTLAKNQGLHSIAFPLISAGIFGYPLIPAWHIALESCRDFITDNPEYDIRIVFAVLDSRILEEGSRTLRKILPENLRAR